MLIGYARVSTVDLNWERTLEGMKAALARGGKGGRPRTLSSEDQVIARTLLVGRGFLRAERAGST